MNKSRVKWFLSLNIREFHHDREGKQPTGEVNVFIEVL
jgi:hypothetical protein